MEDVLAQRIYAVEFAWGYTVVARHTDHALAWLDRLEQQAGPGSRAALQPARAGMAALQSSLRLLRRFVEEKDLASLDRGLAQLRRAVFPLQEAAAAAELLGGALADLPQHLFLDPAQDREWDAAWKARVQRHQGESRVTFTCKQCGWELSYVSVVGSAEQLEVPFSELECPFCSPGEPE